MMLRSPAFFILCQTLIVAQARVWTDIATFHRLSPLDLNIGANVLEHDPLRFTAMPSMVPSMAPTSLPTINPSQRPSLAPSISPTLSILPTVQESMKPSANPSRTPTFAPTLAPTTKSPTTKSPTARPSQVTLSPTTEPYPENDLPVNVSTTFFNYEIDRFALYGPGFPEWVRHNATNLKIEYQNNGWKNAKNPNGTDFYWGEFDANGYGPWRGVLANRELGTNQCGNVGKQSPIDLKASGAPCVEHHQIRTRRGDYEFDTSLIEPRIESNKLRLKFQRRPCVNLTNPVCAEPDPPVADFPNDWGGYADLMHVDFKIPSEHTIEGERFDGEMQIVHIHPSRRRTPTLSVLIRAKRAGYNPLFQEVLDQFQYVYNDHGSKCWAQLRRERRQATAMRRVLGKLAQNEPDYDSWADFSTQDEDPSFNVTDRRKLQGSFTPHDEMLVPSIHFYGYEGSITEPPCSEFVTWFVSDLPMTIGLTQLEQMKRILFTHVSPTCEKTSVHFAQSVARPLQDAAGRPVWRCTKADFVEDDHRFIDDDLA